ncbi:hypothetical protein Hte_005329 [Hypoxylon texense]
MEHPAEDGMLARMRQKVEIAWAPKVTSKDGAAGPHANIHPVQRWRGVRVSYSTGRHERRRYPPPPPPPPRPVSMFYLAPTIRGAASAALKPYDYGRIHHGNNPYPWDAILFVPSRLLGSSVVDQPRIPISQGFALGYFGGGATAWTN